MIITIVKKVIKTIATPKLVNQARNTKTAIGVFTLCLSHGPRVTVFQ